MKTALVDGSPSEPVSKENQHPVNLTIYCDFDGPIVDVSARYYGTYECALAYTQSHYRKHGEALKLSPLTSEQFWQMKKTRVSDVEIAMRSGLQEKQIEFFLTHVRAIVNHQDLLRRDRLQWGVNWAVRLMHSQGVKLVIVTLRNETQVHNILNSYGLKRHFVDVYGAKENGIAYANNSEHKVALLNQAIAKHGNHNAFMVGDTEADIIAAQQADIPVIALTCGIRSHFYLKKFTPDFIYPNLLATTHRLLKAA